MCVIHLRSAWHREIVVTRAEVARAVERTFIGSVTKQQLVDAAAHAEYGADIARVLDRLPDGRYEHIHELWTHLPDVPVGNTTIRNDNRAQERRGKPMTYIEPRSMPLERFPSLAAYNSAHPSAPLPSNVRLRAEMRGFDAAGTGIEDDISASGELLSIEFLPDGAPRSDELDRIGTVVATGWGQAPVFVVAEGVSLRAAWKATAFQWPTTLSATVAALAQVRRHTP